MNNDEVIQRWQQKIQSDFGDQGKLFQYLTETMDNFYYRYLETALSKNLKSVKLDGQVLGAESFESSMVDALKISHPEAHRGIMELAKSVPKSQGPKVRYRLGCEVIELGHDQGHLRIQAEVNWGYPDFEDPNKRVCKIVDFPYRELAQFRKELALKLEEACALFL